MADITANSISTARPFFLSRIVEGLFDALVTIGEQNSRVRQLERLTALSDDELARRGLKREDLVRHVFSDSLYL